MEIITYTNPITILFENEDGHINDELLDQIKNQAGPYFSKIYCQFDGEEIPGKIMFLDVIFDHPRFDEFMQIEVDHIIRGYFTEVSGGENPMIPVRFAEIMVNTILEKCGNGEIEVPQGFGGFLGQGSDVKSARK